MCTSVGAVYKVQRHGTEETLTMSVSNLTFFSQSTVCRWFTAFKDNDYDIAHDVQTHPFILSSKVH